jgi:hypothetical protein
MRRAMRVARLGAGLAGSYLGYQAQRLLLDILARTETE